MIEIEDISKSYGNTLALDGLSLSIDDGDIFGYIGPNGAGKSTTFKILATLLVPSSGQAIIDGFSVQSQAGEVRRRIGYMPDTFGAYDDMSVNEYLTFFAALYDIPPKDRKVVVGGVLELTDLTGKKRADVQTLSRGMTQRLGLARVLLHDPKVLLLDEPASGLDPRARVEIRELLKELRTMGKTILISSHILSELAEISTRIGIIERGKLQFAGTPGELHKAVQVRPTILLTVRDTPAESLVVVRELDFVDEVRLEGNTLEIVFANETRDAGDVVQALVERGHRILSVRDKVLDLETCFMLLTKGQVA